MDLHQLSIFRAVAETRSFSAAAGIGIAIVPGFAAQRHNKAGSLELLPLDGLAEREIGTATYRGSRRSAATNAFVDLCLPIG